MLKGLIERFARRQKERKARDEAEARERQLAREQEAAIKALPIDEARCQAEELLADPARCECNRLQTSVTDEWRLELQRLAPLLQEFFGQYDCVKLAGEGSGWNALTGELESSINEEGEEDDRLLVIGQVDCFGGKYLAKPGEETIYTRWETDTLEPRYPTIYHAVICIDRFERSSSNSR